MWPEHVRSCLTQPQPYPTHLTPPHPTSSHLTPLDPISPTPPTQPYLTSPHPTQPTLPHLYFAPHPSHPFRGPLGVRGRCPADGLDELPPDECRAHPLAALRIREKSLTAVRQPGRLSCALQIALCLCPGSRTEPQLELQHQPGDQQSRVWPPRTQGGGRARVRGEGTPHPRPHPWTTPTPPHRAHTSILLLTPPHRSSPLLTIPHL